MIIIVVILRRYLHFHLGVEGWIFALMGPAAIFHIWALCMLVALTLTPYHVCAAADRTQHRDSGWKRKAHFKSIVQLVCYVATRS
jgi:hypothetical protein